MKLRIVQEDKTFLLQKRWLWFYWDTMTDTHCDIHGNCTNFRIEFPSITSAEEYIQKVLVKPKRKIIKEIEI